MMRNIILISSLLIILLFPYSSLADTGVSSINPAVAKLSQQIWDSGLSLFKGEVELISSSGIYIDLKEGAGIKEGMECEVFRGVEERREKCAEVRIRWAGERMAIAEPLAGYSLESIKVGDEVMAKPTFRRILVLDFVTSRGEKNNFTDLVSQILASDLLDFPQIQVIRESQLSLDLRKKIALLRKGEGFDPSIAQSIGNFGGIILGTATDLGVVIDLRVSVIDTGTGLVRAVAAEDIIKDISVSLLFSPSAKPSEDKYMLKRRANSSTSV